MKNHLKKYFFHPLEFLLIGDLYFFLRLLPFSWASGLMGFLAKKIGPKLKISSRASRQMAAILPELTPAQIDENVVHVWENLGRVFGEYPHLARFDLSHQPWLDIEIAPATQKIFDGSKSIIFLSAHFANWEILGRIIGQRMSKVLTLYRPANNPWTDWLINYNRRQSGVRLAPKGRRGLREMVAAIRDGESLAMLIDQRVSEGISSPFLGVPAMTAQAFADLAATHDLPIVLCRIDRRWDKRQPSFKVHFEHPIYTKDFSSKLAVIDYVNHRYSSWIRNDPGQWFWLHHRWGKEWFRALKK